MSTRASGRSVAVFLCVVLPMLASVLVACSSDDGARSAAPESPSATPAKALTKGTCWSDQRLADALGSKRFDQWVQKYAEGDAALGKSMRDDAAFSKQLACTEPHALELYDVVDLAPALAAQVKQYADLLDQRTPLYRKVRDQVNQRCLAGSPYGRAQRKAGGPPVQLGPALNTAGGLHVAWDPFPADRWTAGEKKFGCLFEQDEPDTLLFVDLTTAKVPVGSRVCLDIPRTYVSCDGRHQAEDIAEMVLNTAIEKGRINGRKAVRKGAEGPYVALSDAEYARLDKVCATFLSSVSKLKAGIEARAYPGAVSQWPTKSGAYVASCFALKPSEPPTPTTGTVFDKA